MPIAVVPLQNPDTSRQIADPADGSLSQNGANIFQGLIDRTGGPSGIPLDITNDMVATGTTQAGAAQLTSDLNEVVTTPAGSGVLLVVTDPGKQQWVFNGGVNPLNVYPPSGMGIDAIAVNGPYSLASGKTQVFTVYDIDQLRSLQLG